MKVPARRRRNAGAFEADRPRRCLNESPSRKEGKCRPRPSVPQKRNRLNESPYEKVGKWFLGVQRGNKRNSLNESPR